MKKCAKKVSNIEQLTPAATAANDWGSDLDELQIRKLQLAEMASEILFMLRKMPESTESPADEVLADIE